MSDEMSRIEPIPWTYIEDQELPFPFFFLHPHLRQHERGGSSGQHSDAKNQ